MTAREMATISVFVALLVATFAQACDPDAVAAALVRIGGVW